MDKEFTKEKVDYAYKILNYSINSEERALYNQYLISFQVFLQKFLLKKETEIAYKICEELLNTTDNLSQFFAAQTIYSKLSKETKFFGDKIPFLLNLRNNIFSLVFLDSKMKKI